MSEVVINFKSEEREGIVAVDTYLIDAAKRLGIDIVCDCFNEEVETKGSCAMKISVGDKLLSEPTKVELELLSDTARKNGERLACQTKIEKSGEVTVMSVKKKAEKEETKDEEEVHKEEFKKQFEELPLEKKISNLMELEAIALNETFSFVMNSPYAAVGKVMDVLADFGLKMEKEDKEAKRPDEHIDKDDEKSDEKESAEKEEKTDKKKSTATAKKKPASKKTTPKKPAAKKKTTAAKKTTAKKTTAKKTTAKKKTSENKDDK